jgi:hypothetical protein
MRLNIFAFCSVQCCGGSSCNFHNSAHGLRTAERKYIQAHALAKEIRNPKLIAELKLLNDPESIILCLKIEEKKNIYMTNLVFEDNRLGFRKTTGDCAMFWDQDDSFPIAFNYSGESYTLKTYWLHRHVDNFLSLYYYSGSKLLSVTLKQIKRKCKTKILLKNLEVVGEEPIEVDCISVSSPSGATRKIDTSEFQNLFKNSTKLQGRAIKTILENSEPKLRNLELVLANNWQQKQFFMQAAGLMGSNLFYSTMVSASLVNPYTAFFTIFSILYCIHFCPSGKSTGENRK